MNTRNLSSLRPADLYAGPVPPVDANDEDADLREVAGRLWRGKWIIAVCMLLALALGHLTAATYVPRWRADARVIIDAPSRDIIETGNTQRRPNVNAVDQIEILRSTALAQKVVTALNLTELPEYNPRLRLPAPTWRDRFGGLLSLPEGIRERLINLGLISAPNAAALAREAAALAEEEARVATRLVLAQLTIAPVPGSNVLRIAVTSGDPETAAAIANAFADQYIDDQLDARLDATRAATDWLSGRVDELRDRLRTAEEAVEIARAGLSLEAGQSLEITQQQLQALNGTLSIARNATRSAAATHERLNAALADGVAYGAIPEFRNSIVIAEFRMQRANLQSERAGLVDTFGAEHPSVQRVDAVLDEADRNMAEEAGQIIEATRLQWQSLRQEEAAIEADVRALETLALEQSRDQVTVRQLEREADASRLLYQNFLGRLQEIAEQQRLEEPVARILSRAEAPLSPLTQRESRTLSVALVAGALAGVGLILLLERLNNTVRTAFELEQLTGETVLGILPVVGQHMRRSAILYRFRIRPKSNLAEAVRSLRTSILYSAASRPPQTVMFTSSVPGEGKSTTAMLFALTSRQMGKSAIMVDCDLRRPALAELVGGVDEGPGLLSAIEGTAALEDVIHKDDETGLHVLMSKPSEPRSGINAADILSSQRFNELMADLRERYDLVIMDTPPTLAVADPRILSIHADTVVYVVRWNHTSRDSFQEGLRDLRTVDAPIGGLVLSMVQEPKATRYAFEGYRSYRARYQNHYVE